MVNIVIAKYKENIDWVLKIKNHNITIYDKSENNIIDKKFCNKSNIKYIKLKNKGREGETFLYHIVNNYDKLDEVTVFLQGNPFDHLYILFGWRDNIEDNEKDLIIDKINNEINDDCKFSSFYQVLYNDYYGSNFTDTKGDCMRYLNEEYEYFTVSPGAQYIVPKKNILSRPFSLWKKLQEDIYNDKFNGYSLEKLWYILYTGSNNYTLGNHDIQKEINKYIYSMSHTPSSYYNLFNQ